MDDIVSLAKAKGSLEVVIAGYLSSCLGNSLLKVILVDIAYCQKARTLIIYMSRPIPPTPMPFVSWSLGQISLSAQQYDEE